MLVYPCIEKKRSQFSPEKINKGQLGHRHKRVSVATESIQSQKELYHFFPSVSLWLKYKAPTSIQLPHLFFSPHFDLLINCGAHEVEIASAFCRFSSSSESPKNEPNFLRRIAQQLHYTNITNKCKDNVRARATLVGT